jgi:hypothetical protein
VVVQLPNPPTTLKGLTMINKSNQFYRNAVCAMAQALDVKDDYATYKNLHSRSVTHRPDGRLRQTNWLYA